MKIYLIRHGETLSGKKHLYLGATDEDLSLEGTESIRKNIQKNMYPKKDNMLLYASSLLRAKHTLTLIYGNASYSALSYFNEIDFGVFELHSYAELKDDAEYQRWISGDNETAICPKGESFCQMEERVIFAFKKYILEGSEDKLLCTHGGPIACIMDYLFPKENKNLYEWSPLYGEGYCIRMDKGLSYTLL